MISYKYFKYLFYRYFAYNILYSLIFSVIPVFLYILIKINVLLKNNDISGNLELLAMGFQDGNFYKISIKQFDNLDKLLVIIWLLIVFTGYIFMIKKILHKVVFIKYKKILVLTKKKKIAWGNVIGYSLINSTLGINGSLVALLFTKYFSFDYTILLCLSQVIGFILYWLTTYFLLNKNISSFCQVRIKPVPYNK